MLSEERDLMDVLNLYGEVVWPQPEVELPEQASSEVLPEQTSSVEPGGRGAAGTGDAGRGGRQHLRPDLLRPTGGSRATAYSG
eukprot:8689595-Heterocapsa_arctica.AAC.1